MEGVKVYEEWNSQEQEINKKLVWHLLIYPIGTNHTKYKCWNSIKQKEMGSVQDILFVSKIVSNDINEYDKYTDAHKPFLVNEFLNEWSKEIEKYDRWYKPFCIFFANPKADSRITEYEC